MIVTDFLVCDDIRHEIDAKNTLIGIYHDFVILADKKEAKLPMFFRLGIYTRIRLEESDKEMPDSFDFEFSQGENKEIPVDKNKIEIKGDRKIFALALSFARFPIKSDEAVHFKIRFYKSGKLICELKPDYKLNVIFKGSAGK